MNIQTSLPVCLDFNLTSTLFTLQLEIIYVLYWPKYFLLVVNAINNF